MRKKYKKKYAKQVKNYSSSEWILYELCIKVKVDESLVSETYKEELVSERTEKPGFFKSLRMTSILFRLMFVQWTVIIFLVGIISSPSRLVYSTDNNWIFFVVITLIFCFIFIPIIHFLL